MREDLKVRAAEMERTALKALIDLVEVNQLVNLPKLLEHRVVEECVSLFNSNGTYRKTQKSKLVQKFSLQSVDLQEPYVALIDMGMIWRMATPTAEDRQMQDSTPYKWSDYVHKVSSIILARHGNAHRIVTHTTQHIPLRMMNETYEYRVGHMSRTSVIDAADTDAYVAAAAISHTSCLVCSVSRESRRQFSAVIW